VLRGRQLEDAHVELREVLHEEPLARVGREPRRIEHAAGDARRVGGELVDHRLRGEARVEAKRQERDVARGAVVEVDAREARRRGSHSERLEEVGQRGEPRGGLGHDDVQRVDGRALAVAHDLTAPVASAMPYIGVVAGISKRRRIVARIAQCSHKLRKSVWRGSHGPVAPAPERWQDLRRMPRAPRRAHDLDALRAIYRESDDLLAGWSCDLSTDCCHFARTGREPSLWPNEWALVEHAIAARGARPSALVVLAERRCPLLGAGDRCTVYETRPFGCRTFFCERAAGPTRRPPRAELAELGRRIAALARQADTECDGPRPLTRLLAQRGR
jgi:Fe-S-cluster containining protein